LSHVVHQKNDEINDLSYRYDKDINDLESKLTNVELDRNGLERELNQVKSELSREKRSASCANLAAQSELADLKSKCVFNNQHLLFEKKYFLFQIILKRLSCAKLKLASVEPKAELAREYERQISSLNAEISHVKSKNAILESHNDFQSALIRSRACSPVCFIRERSLSPPVCTTTVYVY
jgi:chromosome condensin MukBEF ATPase and DNA-binding subunit MukB